MEPTRSCHPGDWSVTPMSNTWPSPRASTCLLLCSKPLPVPGAFRSRLLPFKGATYSEHLLQAKRGWAGRLSSPQGPSSGRRRPPSSDAGKERLRVPRHLDPPVVRHVGTPGACRTEATAGPQAPSSPAGLRQRSKPSSLGIRAPKLRSLRAPTR